MVIKHVQKGRKLEAPKGPSPRTGGGSLIASRMKWLDEQGKNDGPKPDTKGPSPKSGGGSLIASRMKWLDEQGKAETPQTKGTRTGWKLVDTRSFEMGRRTKEASRSTQKGCCCPTVIRPRETANAMGRE